MEEIWKDIIGWNGLYQVSNLGRVKRIYLVSKKTKILKPSPFIGGYWIATLCNEGRAKKFYIHRLVAIAFIPNPNNDPQVNHKDGNKKNNYWLNLEWNSSKKNIEHSYRFGLAKIGEKRTSSKLTDNQAKEIKYLNPLLTYIEMSKIYGISISVISKIRNGKTWKHI